MAEARLTNSVTVRDHTGRFLDRYQEKKRRGLEELMKAGAKRARELAPFQTGRLASTIRYSTGTSGGSWSVGTGYWGPQEFGARPHSMRGDVTFYWQREARFWRSGDNIINHPGNPAVHFMRRSFEETFPTAVDRIAHA